MNYVDHIIVNEKIPEHCEFVVLGFSQGVSIAARWLGLKKNKCDRFIIISGKFPAEITTLQVMHLQHTKVFLTVGENDNLISSELLQQQIERLKALFPKLIEIPHEGGHQIVSSLFSIYLEK